MNSRELVKAAIKHQETSRVPYCIVPTREMRVQIENELHLQPEDFLDNDVIRINPPWWTWDNLTEDWEKMDIPTTKALVKGYGCYEDFADQIKTLKTTGKYILVTIYGSHIEKACAARSLEYFLADMAAEPEFAKCFLEKIIAKNMVMLENVLNITEIDGVLLGSDWGSQRGLLISPDSWNEMIRPGEQLEYDLIHSYDKDVWVHSCGKIELLIPALIEMGVDVLNPIQPECMDIAKLKADYGDKIAFWGGVSTQQTLPYGTVEEVIAEARAVKKLLAQDSGFIFSSSQEIQEDVPLENLKALLQVAQEK